MKLDELAKNRKTVIELLDNTSEIIYDHFLRLVLYREYQNIVRDCSNHIVRILKDLQSIKSKTKISYESYNNNLRAYDLDTDQKGYYSYDMYQFYLKNLDSLRYPEKKPTEVDSDLFYSSYNKFIDEASKRLTNNSIQDDFKDYIITLIGG